MKNSLSLIVFIASFLCSFTLKGGNGQDLESEKYLNYLAALSDQYTVNCFAVIKVKNLNTGEVKEICTKTDFILGAIHRELNLDYDTIGLRKVFAYAKARKDRFFAFKNIDALKNVSFFSYQTGLVSKIKKRYNFDQIVDTIKQRQSYSIKLDHDDMEAFAHVLFNKGYMSGEHSCFGGTLEYVDRTKVIDY